MDMQIIFRLIIQSPYQINKIITKMKLSKLKIVRIIFTTKIFINSFITSVLNNKKPFYHFHIVNDCDEILFNINYRITDSNMKPLIRAKSKQHITSSKNNNFSQKYFEFTKEKKFSTPKKSTISKNQSKESLKPKIQISQKIQSQAVNLNNFRKAPKININMEIKNLNIFGTSSTAVVDSKKKKLHKKTISALGRHQNELKEKIVDKKVVQKKIKHKKTKSQQNIKLSPVEWGQLLAEHSKNTNKQSVNIISKYAYCNRRGFAVDKKDKINQDAFIIIQNFMVKDRFLFGVCDGHGINGHFVSDFIKEILPENIQYFFLKNKVMKKFAKNVVQNTLKEAFLKTSKNLQESGIDINFSGTTACLIYLQQNHLFCANLGDSRAVMFSRLGQKWLHKPVSFDHKAEDQRQAYRIKMNGGRVFPYLDQDGQQMGPFRIWIQQKNVPGLAMTRSFGDYIASTVGVISQPQVTYYQVNKDDKFLVIASDGLWQFISNDQVMQLITPSFIRNNAEQAVQILQKHAVEAWKRQDENIDDITIQVIFFKYY